jgi:hypothetical protein
MKLKRWNTCYDYILALWCLIFPDFVRNAGYVPLRGNHDTSFRKPPATAQTTGQRFYLLTRHHSPLLYWRGSAWSESASAAKAFPSYELAEQERPLAVKSSARCICSYLSTLSLARRNNSVHHSNE